MDRYVHFLKQKEENGHWQLFTIINLNITLNHTVYVYHLLINNGILIDNWKFLNNKYWYWQYFGLPYNMTNIRVSLFELLLLNCIIDTNDRVLRWNWGEGEVVCVCVCVCVIWKNSLGTLKHSWGCSCDPPLSRTTSESRKSYRDTSMCSHTHLSHRQVHLQTLIPVCFPDLLTYLDEESLKHSPSLQHTHLYCITIFYFTHLRYI